MTGASGAADAAKATSPLLLQRCLKVVGDHYSQELVHTMTSTDPSAVLEHGTYVRPPEALPEDGWGRGRASLLGDAAHPLRPTGEQLCRQPAAPHAAHRWAARSIQVAAPCRLSMVGAGDATLLANATDGQRLESRGAACLRQVWYTAWYSGQRCVGLLPLLCNPQKCSCGSISAFQQAVPRSWAVQYIC